MNERKSILITVPRIPFPLNAGGKIAIYSVIEILSLHFDVHLVIITDEPITDIQVSAMEKISKKCEIFYFSKFRCKVNSLKSVYNRLPLQTNYFYFNSVQKYINKVLESIDASYSFMIRTSAYLENSKKFKVLNYIDSLFLSYTRSVEKTSSSLWKLIYQFEIRALKEYETKCINNFNANIFVNSTEATFWSQYSNNVYCLPFGIEQSIIEYDKIESKYNNSIVFFGKMDYQPNVDAVRWFCKNVVPKLPKEITFIIVGASPTNEIRELSQKYKNIEVTGFLEDPYSIIRSSLAVVAPMQTGGGLQTKVLVSMALGAKVIAPQWVIDPIPGALVNINILAAETPDEYLENINNIFKDSLSFSFVGSNARLIAKEKFSWIHYQKANLMLFNEKI